MIQGRLYIESFEGNDNFDVNDSYYADENAYIKALQAEYELNSNLLQGIGSVGVEKLYSNDINYENKSKSVYNSCDCVLKDETIDSFISHNIDGKSFQLLITLDLTNVDEDFEYDLKLWKEVHNKTYTALSKGNNMDVLLSELPCKDLKMSFINLRGYNSYALLEGCTLLEYTTDLSNVLIRVNKLTFIKSIE